MFQIAALSPADINYEETLSTLRFGELSNSYQFIIQSVLFDNSLVGDSKGNKSI